MSKYLFVGSHCDDIELSCGGTVTKLKEQGHSINLLTFSKIYNEVDLSNEWSESVLLMKCGYNKLLDFPVRNFNNHRQQILDILITLPVFDFIFTHSAHDYHQDHAVVGQESLRAFKGQNLITYKAEWNGEINKNYFVHLDERLMHKKTLLLDCYKSQEKRLYMNSQYVYATAMNNGLKCKTQYAEAFEVVNLIN